MGVGFVAPSDTSGLIGIGGLIGMSSAYMLLLGLRRKLKLENYEKQLCGRSIEISE